MGLTQKYLKRILDYDPDTGIFKWKVNKNNKGATKNKKAGTLTKNGYITISIDYKRYYAHRLIWLYVNGYFPENQIDHINRIRNDNKLNNLREVTARCNVINSKVNKKNKVGVTGIAWCKRDKKWISQIHFNKKHIFIGRFKSFKNAVFARWLAEKKYNFFNCNTTSSAYLYLKKHNLLEEEQCQ